MLIRCYCKQCIENDHFLLLFHHFVCFSMDTSWDCREGGGAYLRGGAYVRGGAYLILGARGGALNRGGALM